MIKRIFDILLSIISIIILSPFFIIIGLIVGLTSRGGIFYRQIRVGKDEKCFKIIKFRTMVTNADKEGLSITVGKDRRITGAGKLLRKIRLDEMPQLFNILIGQMSFVGPRPEVPRYVELYNEEQKKVLKVRPGLTDYAAICFKNENELLAKSSDPEKEYIENIMPEKLKYNAGYIEDMSILTDLRILVLTVWAVLGGRVSIKMNGKTNEKK